MIGSDAIRGYVDLMVLSLLSVEPSYAYELAQQIASATADSYAVKQTTLYTAVKRLEVSGLLESFPGISESGKSRTYYKITETGSSHLAQKIIEWRDTKSVVDRFVEGTNQ